MGASHSQNNAETWDLTELLALQLVSGAGTTVTYTEAKDSSTTEKPLGPLSGGISPNLEECNVLVVAKNRQAGKLLKGEG